MIMLSRNCPIAFVVGAAGFIGSHLVYNLLQKGIQVVGVDNLSTGRIENLKEAVKDKRFHFFHQAVEDGLKIDSPRIDYAFFVISDNYSTGDIKAPLHSFLKICQKFKSRILFLSTIDNYDKLQSATAFSDAEKILARFATENKINARVVRLSAVYGPKMHFRENDPLVRLIKSAVLGELQKESTPLDFSTRSLYIDDAINLLIKTILHGATAQKIYDGALSAPIKVVEVKQVLLDPLWHESKGFIPTELPPWQTPNLVKTEKELNWQPKTSLVSGLKETLKYFREDPDALPEHSSKDFGLGLTTGWEKEPADKEKETGNEEAAVLKKVNIKRGRHVLINYLGLSFGILLISYILIYPALIFTWKAVNLKNNLLLSTKYLNQAQFGKAGLKLEEAEDLIFQIEHPLSYLSSIYTFSDQSLFFFSQLVNIKRQGVLGAEKLYQLLNAITDGEGDLRQFSAAALSEFNEVEKKLALLEDKLKNNKTGLLEGYLGYSKEELLKTVRLYQREAGLAKTLALLLPEVVGVERSGFNIIVVDNQMLRPGGGRVKAYGEIVFEEGKLKEVKMREVGSLVKTGEEISLPYEMIKDFNGVQLNAADLLYDPDFPANAKMFQWFYHQKGNNKTSGLISLDLTALAYLLGTLGPIALEDGTVVTGKGIQNSGISDTHLAGLTEEVIKRVLFLSQKDWLGLADAVIRGADEKHLLVYLNQPKLYSYILTTGLSSNINSNQINKNRGIEEVLYLSETDIRGIKNFLVKRRIDWQMTVDKEGKINQEMIITYQGVEEGQKRVKIYLSSGKKLKRAFWNDSDVLKDVTLLSDYGLVGFNLLLKFEDGGSNKLILEYENQNILDLTHNDGVRVDLRLIKQPGTGIDQISYQLALAEGVRVLSGEDLFEDDFSSDKNWSVVLGY